MDEKDFDFEHLTKEQAVYLHRKLWNTLSDKILEWGRPVEKHEIFELYGWPKTFSLCWCCHYAGIGNCSACPIKWNEFKGRCRSGGSPFMDWYFRMCLYRRLMHSKLPAYFEKWQLEELASWARKIAELPEKEE